MAGPEFFQTMMGKRFATALVDIVKEHYKL